MSLTLLGRRPHLSPGELVSSLVPPRHFRDATFATYRPNCEHTSQSDALVASQRFAERVTKSARKGRRRGRGGGLYLDGGFGVGKTHLLVSIAREVGGPVVYGTFVEYTNLVGALGFAATRGGLQEFAVVCIDEFELDDPGDTLLMARLMRELADAGVSIAATSNTVPGALGEGRFAAEDFQREIQSVAELFDIVRVDGPDYRHRHTDVFPIPSTAADAAAVSEAAGGTCVGWDDLIADIAKVHPSRYGAYLDGVDVLGISGVCALQDQSQALRLVTLVDRLYDRDARLVLAGVPIDQIFGETMLRGGYRKKYLRARSRLLAMVSGESLLACAQRRDPCALDIDVKAGRSPAQF